MKYLSSLNWLDPTLLKHSFQRSKNTVYKISTEIKNSKI